MSVVPLKEPTPWPNEGPMISKGLITVPKPQPLCVHCPAAWWYEQRDQPTCFCTQFRAITFSALEAPVTACDAREDAIQIEHDKNKPK